MTTPPAVDDERTEELRLALVLNGGVSLAVWMSGVAFELNRLVRETHPVYRALLQLTGTAARIDVISGTSAGGINGAALALAQVHDRSLLPLREVWLDTAGLERLLRNPDEADPRSLLRGDAWFLPRIQQAFQALRGNGRPTLPPAAVPMQLTLTTTLLDGLVHKRLDDFGATVEDKVHRALWSFERGESGDDFAPDRRIVEQLALAARSTASFPVAFEPVEVDPASTLFGGKLPLRARIQPGRSFDGRVFLLDGGILDNQPFDAALEGIARLPAAGHTRRVLAYVVPDPAASAERRKPGPDGELPKPTLAEVAWRSLVSIPASQSIASHMARLRSHNDETTRRWQRLVGAVSRVGAAALTAQARQLLPAYRARRIDGVIDYLLEEIELGLAAAGGDRDIGMRRATRQWLASTWRNSIDRQPALWASRVPVAFEPAQPLVTGPQPAWTWGLYALEFAADFTIEVLRRTQRLRALVQRWSQPPDSTVPGPALPRATAAGTEHDDVHWEQADLGQGALGRADAEGRQRIGDTLLQPLWDQAFRTARALRQRRASTSRSAEQSGGAGFVELVHAWSERGGEQPPLDKAHALIGKLLGDNPEDPLANAGHARALCALLAALQPPIEDVLRAHALAPAGRSDIDESVAELSALHRYLFEPLAGDAGALPDRLAWRLLALEVFELSAGSRRHEPGAPAELVQISGRLRSAWGGSDDPAARLNGMQLAHFGAFYKRSWRANDWTFGRLDGIDRALRIALNPDALQRRFGRRRVDAGDGGPPLASSVYVRRYLHALAVTSAEPALRALLQSRWDGEEAAIAEELAWLDQHSTVPPPVLERCAAALTRRLQLEVLRHELPEIAKSLLAEREGGAATAGGPGAALLARVAPDGVPRTPSPEDAVALVGNDLLGAERLADQPGTDQFTRTASQALATAHAALSSRHGGLDAIQVLFRVTEWPVRILYWLAHRLAGGSRTGAALEGAVLGVGAALVAASLLTDKLPSTAVGVGWALLAGVLAATLLRHLALGKLFLAVALLGVAVLKPAAVWPALGACVLLWLLLRPWAAPLALAAIVLVAAWWGAGGSVQALQDTWQQFIPWGGARAPLSAERAQAVQRLLGTLAPALVVAALLGVSALSRRLSGPPQPRRPAWLQRLHAWRQPPGERPPAP